MMGVVELVDGYRAGGVKPSAVIRKILQRIDEDPAVWISRFSDSELMTRAEALDGADAASLPLYGVPFAVKDNIDVAGLPTTAACPAYSYQPEQSAFVVQRLLDAGAICLGKTNLDQFATGLVGVRSPYGVPKNAVNPEFIPGGSSAGSAVAVARGLAAFALGTDTAGSGRVPAAFNDIVGWKPTRGLLSNSGLVPACRSLDCISVFTRAAKDLPAILDVVAVFDPSDAFARPDDGAGGRAIRKLGIPTSASLEFFGDAEYERLWHAAVADLRGRDLEVIEIDLSPFLAAARLLYEGPWVAERYLAARDILESQPEAMHPVTRTIIEKGASGSAADAFSAQYRLAELRREADTLLAGVDALCIPTAGTIYRVAEVEADPIRTNSNLGTYTNFMNLLDLCGLAVPAGARDDGMPFGITYVAAAFRDRDLLRLAGCEISEVGDFRIAVCGAHMTGLPLNGQLTERGGSFECETSTAAEYRLYALDDKRPGLVRVGGGGASVALEIWRIPVVSVGSFLAGIPAPLGLGRVRLADGSEVCGFVCESAGAIGKPDISEYGGWRAWLEQR